MPLNEQNIFRILVHMLGKAFSFYMLDICASVAIFVVGVVLSIPFFCREFHYLDKTYELLEQVVHTISSSFFFAQNFTGDILFLDFFLLAIDVNVSERISLQRNRNKAKKQR